MSGDYTRFTFDPLKRFSGVLMQQGRVQLDSDWNEEIDILRRRIRTTTLDILGPLGVPYPVTPNAFSLGWIPGPPTDLSIAPGRLYVDGIQIEAFAEDGATYNHQPFFPPQLAGFGPPVLPVAGDAVAYLDVWEREITYIEDPELLDAALGGADTTTRRQTVWQLRIDPMPGAACGVPVGPPASAGRLTTHAVAPPAPDDPCILPPASGYRGLENRLYRVEIHDGGALGAARFKWSRDNGSIVSAVRDIAVSGGQTTLTVNRIGRDKFLRFRAGDWVTVTDDHRDWMGEPGEMALVVNIDETNRQIVLDRALPTGANRPLGANAAEIAARHTKIQKWDQSGATNAVDADGLIATAAGPIAIEDGIEIDFSVAPPGGLFRQGDYWLFWARTATAQIEELTNAPPRGIRHHYIQIAAITGLGGGGGPVITDCRPPPQQGSDCCCTIVIRPGEDIQAGIDALPPQGGCVCLKTGVHTIRQPLRIQRGSIVLKAESPGTSVQSVGPGSVLIIGNPTGLQIEGVDILGIDFIAGFREATALGVIAIAGANRVRISHCSASSRDPRAMVGIVADATDNLSISGCRFSSLLAGIFIRTRCEGFEADENILDLDLEEGSAVFGIAYVESAFPCRITRNAISAALYAILLNDAPFGAFNSLADLSIIRDNIIVCPRLPEGNAALRPAAIDVAAAGCAITGNRIRYADRAYIGIRVSGSLSELSGNVLVSLMKTIDAPGPVAIQIGSSGSSSTKPVLAGIIVNNEMVGPQHGVVCSDAGELIIKDNVIIDSFGGLLGLAIAGIRLTASEISGNRIRGALSGVFLLSGRENRIASNDCRSGQIGISLFQETGPQITGNRLDQLDRWGIYAIITGARLDIVENRLVKCATAMPNIAFGIGCYGVAGEANISANEVMDTGSDGSALATSAADYGILADLVLEARVEGNLVTYSNVGTRNPLREDRALVMRGLLELSQGGDDGITFGFAVQILGNKFVGNGRTALVELRQTQLNNQVFVRFERVSFDHNYCSHFSAQAGTAQLGATVWLVGRRAIVMGNHIKALSRAFPSVNFNNMPGPFIGNVTAGGTINHADFPVPAASFNMIAL